MTPPGMVNGLVVGAIIDAAKALLPIVSEGACPRGGHVSGVPVEH